MDQEKSYIVQYLELKNKLLEWRKFHPEDTAEEDHILDEMDRVWWKMNKSERLEVQK